MQFKPFSKKQKLALQWWAAAETRSYDALICDGSVRSGKTLCMSLGFVLWATAEFQGAAFAICGKTITALRRNVVTPLLGTLRSLGFQCTEKVSQNYADIALEGCPANRFYFFGGKDEGSAALIQGMTLSGILLDEVALMPQSFAEQAIARCSVPHSRLWFNCNPEHPSHWFYREWICKAQEKHALYLHFTMADNPSLTPAIRKRYERLYSGVFYERFVLGKWVLTGGLVYPMFSKDRHVCKPLPPQQCTRFVISCDYGTVNPSSFGLWGECAGIWYRLAEYYYDARKQGRSRTDEEHYAALEQLAGDLPIDTLIMDPSAASMITCIERHGRFPVLRADNRVLVGIQRVSEALQQGRICICETCTDILQEFSLYCWDQSASGDAPRKEHDHAMDDLRYFVMGILAQPGANRFFAASTARTGSSAATLEQGGDPPHGHF